MTRATSRKPYKRVQGRSHNNLPLRFQEEFDVGAEAGEITEPDAETPEREVRRHCLRAAATTYQTYMTNFVPSPPRRQSKYDFRPIPFVGCGSTTPPTTKATNLSHPLEPRPRLSSQAFSRPNGRRTVFENKGEIQCWPRREDWQSCRGHI